MQQKPVELYCIVLYCVFILKALFNQSTGQVQPQLTSN